MARILAIENDAKQASLLKCVVRNHVGASLVVVRSKDEAIAAIRAEAPDLILLSALLSPRDEEDVMAHLRTLDGADYLQTLTTPRFSSSSGDESKGGLLRVFRRRRAASGSTGCDPRKFAEEIVGYLQRAEEMKAERAAIAEAAAITAREAERRAAEIAEQPATETAEITEPLAPAVAEAAASFSTERAEVTESFITEPAEVPERLTTETTETTEVTEPLMASAVESSEVIPAPVEAMTARQETPLVDTAAQPAAAVPVSPPQPAPRAIWAKGIDAGRPVTAPGDEAVVADEVRALLRTLRLPLFLAELAAARGCRIRRIRTARPPVRGRRALATA